LPKIKVLSFQRRIAELLSIDAELFPGQVGIFPFDLREKLLLLNYFCYLMESLRKRKMMESEKEK
jgi:hypothetical protein